MWSSDVGPAVILISGRGSRTSLTCYTLLIGIRFATENKLFLSVHFPITGIPCIQYSSQLKYLFMLLEDTTLFISIHFVRWLSVHFPILGIPCIQYSAQLKFSGFLVRGPAKCLNTVHKHSFCNQIPSEQTCSYVRCISHSGYPVHSMFRSAEILRGCRSRAPKCLKTVHRH